jgi:AraC-like DNA-binding protein
MDRAQLLSEVKGYITETGMTDGFRACGVRGMGVLQSCRIKAKSCTVMEPLISLVLQGQKWAQYGTHRVDYSAGDVVIVGQSLPTISSVVDVSPAHPFIAVYIALDLQILRSVYNDMGGAGILEETGPALEVGQAEEELVEAIARMFRLRRDRVEEQTLGDAMLREVYFRVLRSKYSGALLQMIHHDSKASQIARAIAHIRKEYRSTIKAEELAAIAGMSTSVFYETFRQITANSPLQYQKDLRLLDAHQMLQTARTPVSEVAHLVGYESAAQFSREFSRKFGAPPKAVAAMTV